MAAKQEKQNVIEKQNVVENPNVLENQNVLENKIEQLIKDILPVISSK